MSPIVKSPLGLLVRCFAQEKAGQWQAFSLEFGLAAQGDTFPEARHKLESMIESYVFDALAGDDREHALVLLRRRASPAVYRRYYSSLWVCKLARLFAPQRPARRSPKHVRLFREPVRLAPVHSH